MGESALSQARKSVVGVEVTVGGKLSCNSQQLPAKGNQVNIPELVSGARVVTFGPALER